MKLSYFIIRLMLFVGALFFAGCRSGGELASDGAGGAVMAVTVGDVLPFQSSWNLFEDRIWVGNDLWADSLDAWQIKSGQLLCKTDVDALQIVSLVSRKVVGASPQLSFKVRLNCATNSAKYGAAGFVLGLPEPDLVNKGGKKSSAAGVFAGISSTGKLVIQVAPTLWRLRDEFSAETLSTSGLPDSVELILTAELVGGRYTLLLQAFDAVSGLELSRMSYWHVPAALVQGYSGLAAVAYKKGDSLQIGFDLLRVGGAAVVKLGGAESDIGPIVGVWHTLSNGGLRMTVQMMPVGQRLNFVKLQFFEGSNWVTKACSDINPVDFRATFNLDKVDTACDHPYRVEYGESLSNGSIKYYYRSGTIASAGALGAGTVVLAEAPVEISCDSMPKPDVYIFYDVPVPPDTGQSLKRLRDWYRWCFANREFGRDSSCLGIYNRSMTYRRVRIEVAETAAVAERDINDDWTGWRDADMKVVCAPDMFRLAAQTGGKKVDGKVNDALATAESGFGYLQVNAPKRSVVYNRVMSLGKRTKICAGWPISCKHGIAYDRNHVGYLPAVEIMGRSNAVVQVINENTGELVYSVRSDGTVLLPRVFEVGHYSLIVGEPGESGVRKFENLTPGSAAKTEAIRVAL